MSRGDLEQGLLPMPFLVGRLPEEALDALRTVGFTGTLSVVRLSSDDASVSRPAGRVTDSRPTAGELAPPGADVAVYVNAGAPAPLTEEERERVDALEAELFTRLERERDPFRSLPVPPAEGPWDEAVLEERARLERALAGT